ncbi:MAG TPA: LytTR family DNA-binding domain-containing protein [Thermoanaerobaculia bacterium]|nr:LytTR family DNA-binding domain-containing protein [Thermoanaerobaculia bacterium]
MAEAEKIRVLIVDDEPVARRGIRYLLQNEPDATIVGECGSGLEAVRTIESERPDLVFLDVRMPELDGFGVLEALRVEPPAVVFVTAFDDHAVAAFEVAAIDYLTKPVGEARFQKAFERARIRLRDRKEGRTLERLVVRVGNRIDIVPVETIDWIEAAGDYCCLHVGKRTHVLSQSLASLEARLDSQQFLRIHRGRILNVNRIRQMSRLFHGEYVFELEDGTRLTSGRRYNARIKSYFGAK